MENAIPKYNIDFRRKGQEHFFLYVKELADRSRAASTEPHSHNYYCLTFLYEGETPHYVDVSNEIVCAPALLVLNLDQVHIHAAIGECRLVSMAFSPDFIHGQSKKLGDYIETIFSQPHVQLSGEQLTELDKYIQLICAEHAKGERQDVDVIRCLLNIVLIQSAKFIGQATTGAGAKKDMFTHFRQLLKKHYRSNHQVKFYADQLNVTPEVLNQAVKNASNKTPKQIIDEQLLIEAKRLLYWSDITAREVAWELGFETDGYFNRFFKKFAGTTPKEFQKSTHSK